MELFFELARQCPDVEFIAVGAARDPERDRALRERYGSIPNLHMTGVLDQFETPEWSEVLGRSWILVNSSAREGLPTAFIEAAAHRCGILSFTDPDGFATRFGQRRQKDGSRKACATCSETTVGGSSARPAGAMSSASSRSSTQWMRTSGPTRRR